MNVMNNIVAEPLVLTSPDPEGLADIRKDSCAASIWSREPSPAFQAWIDRLDPKQLPNARVILQPERVREALTQICAQSGTPECDERDQLIDDASALAMMFADLMETPFVRLRMDVVQHNACRKFHIDALTARLICTYRGTGTQYGVGERGKDPAEIATVPCGSPIVLRGTLWPTSAEPGLLHRSPPIEGTGETRLVLVLDPVADAGEAPQHASLH